mgnify:CR=1 FL=1
MAACCGYQANYQVGQQVVDSDVDYLIFLRTSDSPNNDVGGFSVDKSIFTTRTFKPGKSNRRGTRYSVQPGKRKVRVELDGKTLYDRFVFLSPQETKKITLP